MVIDQQSLITLLLFVLTVLSGIIGYLWILDRGHIDKDREDLRSQLTSLRSRVEALEKLNEPSQTVKFPKQGGA